MEPLSIVVPAPESSMAATFSPFSHICVYRLGAAADSSSWPSKFGSDDKSRGPRSAVAPGGIANADIS
jgi:hypothetical protein